MKVIVLSKNDYSFPDVKTGEIREGSKVHYVIESDTEPISLSINPTAKNMHLMSEIEKFPGLYEFSTTAIVKKGQLIQSISNAKFIKEVDLFK